MIEGPDSIKPLNSPYSPNPRNIALNPTPNQSIGWGEMTAQEMMLPWFGVIVDRDAKPEMIAKYKPGDFDGPFPMVGGPIVGGQILDFIRVTPPAPVR